MTLFIIDVRNESRWFNEFASTSLSVHVPKKHIRLLWYKLTRRTILLALQLCDSGIRIGCYGFNLLLMPQHTLVLHESWNRGAPRREISPIFSGKLDNLIHSSGTWIKRWVFTGSFYWIRLRWPNVLFLFEKDQWICVTACSPFIISCRR